MFSVSTSVVLLVFFVSQALAQNTSSVGPSLSMNVSPSTSSAVLSSSSVSGTQSTNSSSSNLTTTSSTSTLTSTSSTFNATTKPTTKTSEEPTTSPSIKTCAKLSVVIDKPWSDDYKSSTSENFLNVSNAFSSALKKLYKDFAKNKYVEVSEVQFTEKEANLSATSAKLCLVFNGGDDVFIEDVFKKKVATGKLDTDLPVIKDSAEFKPLGVSFKDWKAKEGECQKCEGAGGPFLLVKECEPETGFSCDGLIEPTKETDECPTHCSSTAVTVSSVILVIGVFLSSSFQ